MPAKTPEQRRAYDAARRRPERLKLRLTEDEAGRLRNAADAKLSKALAALRATLQTTHVWRRLSWRFEAGNAPNFFSL